MATFVTLHVFLHQSWILPLRGRAASSINPRALCSPQLAGANSHHIVEATFKAFARALRQATSVDERRRGQIASSKGVLTQQ